MLANGGTVIGHENWRTHVISPHIESHKSKSRREAKDWCIEHRPRLTINEFGAGAVRQAAKVKAVRRAKMIVRVVMFISDFPGNASASATAEISDNGRLGIGQGANSCWAFDFGAVGSVCNTAP
jgi:hypothetical protein